VVANQSQNQSLNRGSGAHTGLTDVASVRDYLQARINPAVVINLEARICLAWPRPIQTEAEPSSRSDEPNSQLNFELTFELKQGQLIWLATDAQAQATFWFRDAQDVGHLLSSSDSAYADFMQRFMAAELSSDGYLPWAFTLLSLFRGGSSMSTAS
jgi:hypothetical protein